MHRPTARATCFAVTRARAGSVSSSSRRSAAPQPRAMPEWRSPPETSSSSLDADNVVPPDFLERLRDHYLEGADFVTVEARVINLERVVGRFKQASSPAGVRRAAQRHVLAVVLVSARSRAHRPLPRGVERLRRRRLLRPASRSRKSVGARRGHRCRSPYSRHRRWLLAAVRVARRERHRSIARDAEHAALAADAATTRSPRVLAGGRRHDRPGDRGSRRSDAVLVAWLPRLAGLHGVVGVAGHRLPCRRVASPRLSLDGWAGRRMNVTISVCGVFHPAYYYGRYLEEQGRLTRLINPLPYSRTKRFGVSPRENAVALGLRRMPLREQRVRASAVKPWNQLALDVGFDMAASLQLGDPDIVNAWAANGSPRSGARTASVSRPSSTPARLISSCRRTRCERSSAASTSTAL